MAIADMSRSSSPIRTARTAVVGAAVLFVCGAVPGHAVAQSDVPSIMEFVAAQDKWPQRTGRPLTLEGRYTSLSNTELRFAGCDMRFLLPKSFNKPRLNTNNVEVSGQIEKQNGELVFVVLNVKTRPSDAEVLDRKRVTIDTSRPEALYELGRWARDRGKFYEDSELIAAGGRILESGLAREFDTLDSQDAEGMRSLAMKAAALGLADRLRLRYLHEANRTAFEAERAKPKPMYQALLRTLAQELPGSGEPLPPDKQSLQKDYAKEPRLAYRIADDPTRRLLDRIFYSEVTLADIERDAAGDGSNGDEIAARIEQHLPERRELARSYRDRELEYRGGRIALLTRDQMLDLAGRHDERGTPDRAAEVKRQWLDARMLKASADGPLAFIELGEDYLNLLQDERGAARIFQLAYEANPQLTTASNWLAEHGYELKDGRWSLPGNAAKVEQDNLAAAIHEGRVLEGMTGSQVRAALGGTPTTVVRIASADQIAEVWLYEELGISVQLTRRSHQKELNVRRVTNAP